MQEIFRKGLVKCCTPSPVRYCMMGEEEDIYSLIATLLLLLTVIPQHNDFPPRLPMLLRKKLLVSHSNCL